MFRTLADFEKAWAHEREATLKILKALTDQSLSQAVGEDDRTLGRMAWHLAQTMSEMLPRTPQRSIASIMRHMPARLP